MQNILEFETPRRGVNWKNVAIVASFHLLAIPVFFTFSWQNLAALLIGNWIVGSPGVGLEVVSGLIGVVIAELVRKFN